MTPLPSVQKNKMKGGKKGKVGVQGKLALAKVGFKKKGKAGSKWMRAAGKFGNQAKPASAWHRQWSGKKKAKAQGPPKLSKCKVCCVEFIEENLKDHYSTELHKELVEVKQHWLWEARFHKTLEEQIQIKGCGVPFVGLQYVKQYQPNEKDEHTYECTLCHGVYRPRAVFYHVLSVQHRLLYLAKHHASMGIGKNYQVTTREQYQHLVTCTAKAAQIDGKKPIKIMDHIYVPKPEVEGNDGDKTKTQKQDDVCAGKMGPTGIGMGVINQALSSMQQTRSSEGQVSSQNVDLSPTARQSAPVRGPAADGRNPAVQKSLKPSQSAPGMRSGNQQKDILGLLSAFLDARSRMNTEDSGTPHAANDGRPTVSQGGSVMSSGAAKPPSLMSLPGINALGPINQALGIPKKPVIKPILPSKYYVPFVKPADPGKPFLELKAAYEAKMRKQMGISEDLKPGSVEEEAPFEYDPNYFWFNEELYDFLENFAVENKDDVGFVLKVTELFANSLVRHKQRTEDIKQRILEEKKKLEKEKRAFLSAPGVHRALKQKEQAKLSSSSSPPPAAKRKATAELSSNDKPLFPIGSPPATPEPPSKAKRLLSLSFDSYRPQARNTTPPRRLSGSKVSEAQAKLEKPPSSAAETNRPQGHAAGNASPRRQQQSGPQFSQSRPPSDQRPSFGQTSNRPQGPSTANANLQQQKMQGSQFNQTGPSSGQRQGFGQTSDRPQGQYAGPSAANANPSQQRMPDSQFSQSQPSDQRREFSQASNRPQGAYMGSSANPSQPRMPFSNQRAGFGQTSNQAQGYPTGPSAANTNPSQPRMASSQFNQPGHPSGPKPGFGQATGRPQGPYTGPSAGNANSSQQRRPGSRFDQPRPSDQRPAFGQTSNRPEGPATTNTNPSQQRMSGSQFNTPNTSDSRPAYGPQGSGSNFQQNQNPFGPRGNVQGSGIRPPFGSRTTFNQPRQPMPDQGSALYQPRPALAEQKSHSDQSRMQTNENRPPMYGQRQPLNQSWHTTTDSRNPANVPRPPTEGYTSTSIEQKTEKDQANDRRPPMTKDGLARPVENEPPVSESRPSWQERRSGMAASRESDPKDSRSSWQDRGPATDKSRGFVNASELSWQDKGPAADKSRGFVNASEPSWQDKGQAADKSRGFVNVSEPSWQDKGPATDKSRGFVNVSEPSWQEQRKPNEQYSSSNKPRSRFSEPHFNETKSSLNPTNQSRPSYESSAYYKESEGYPNPQYGNSGYNSGPRSSYGPGDGRPEGSDAYYKEKKTFTSSQFGNHGSTGGGTRPSYGPGPGGSEESTAYYKENEGYTSYQYGNSGSTASAKSSYGSGAGRPEESNAYYKENEKYTGYQYGNTGATAGTRASYGTGGQGESNAYYKEGEGYTGSQYGNSATTGGTGPSYASGAGQSQGSVGSYGYYNQQYNESNYNVQHHSQYGSVDPQNIQYPASMSASYGMNEGNWSNTVPPGSDAYPSTGPGTSTSTQAPYASNQGTTTYNESWK